MRTVPTPIITKPLRWKFVKTCDVINKVTRRKSNKTVNELKPNGTKTNNSTEIVETFDKFFAEIDPEMSKEVVLMLTLALTSLTVKLTIVLVSSM